MVSRARRRLTAEKRRAKIVSAAVQAFATDGYDRTSMDRIAALSKVTKPVLYDHFPSKQALFLTVLESIRDGLIDKGKAIAEAGDGPEQKFRRAVDAFLQFVEGQPDAARVLLMVPRGDTAAAKISREVQAGAAAGIAVCCWLPGNAGKPVVKPAGRCRISQRGSARRCRVVARKIPVPRAKRDRRSRGGPRLVRTANEGTRAQLAPTKVPCCGGHE